MARQLSPELVEQTKQALRPWVVNLIAEKVGSPQAAPAGSSGVQTHAYTLHTGTIPDAHAPQFLKADGSRALEDNLPVNAGVTVDGVDVSAHAADANAHHAKQHSLVDGAHHTAGGGGQYQMLWQPTAGGLGWVASADDVSGDGAGVVKVLRSVGGSTRFKDIYTPIIYSTGDVTLTPTGAVVLSDGKALRSVTFVSGFAGSGFRFDQGVAEAGKTTAEVDNLWVRGRMHVYELLIHQIRATNGSIFVSNTGKAATVTYISGASWQIDTDPEHGFAAGDLIRAQRFTGTGTYQCNMQVASVATTKQFTATWISGASPAAGMEFVRLGSATVSTRRGGVYLTADDSGAPFIDVFDGVDAFADWNTAGVIKARLGSLAGLGIGSAGEYGLFVGTGQATSNTYLKAGTAGVVQNNIGSTWYSGGSKIVEITAADGITLFPLDESYSTNRAYTFSDGSSEFAGLYAGVGATARTLQLNVGYANATGSTSLFIDATNSSGGYAQSALNAQSGTRGAGMYGRVDATNNICETLIYANAASGTEAYIQMKVGVLDAWATGLVRLWADTSGYFDALGNGLVFSLDNNTNYASLHRLSGGSVTTGARLGIGTSSPGYTLDVVGTANVSGALTAGQARFTANSATVDAVGTDHAYYTWYPRGFATGRKAYLGFPSAGTTSMALVNEDTGSLSAKTNGNVDQLVLLAGGNVGIGNATGSEKLHVSGLTLAQAFRATVDTGGSTSSGICYTGASQGVSTGTGTVKMGAGNNRNSDLWIKVYVGTTAYFIPAWSNIS